MALKAGRGAKARRARPRAERRRLALDWWLRRAESYQAVDVDQRAKVPVCSEVTHPFALKLTTLAERNWLGRSVSDASAESSKLSL